MTEREQRLNEIVQRLGKRQLIWFGVRGADAQLLLEMPNFRGCFSLIAPLDNPDLQFEVCLEAMRGERVDLETYDIDSDDSADAAELHVALLAACSMPTALVAYRPCSLLSTVAFSRSTTVEYLGPAREIQAIFEHKAWVDVQLSKLGIRVIPWEYLTSQDMAVAERKMRTRPIVVRSNRTSGGSGLSVVRDPDELKKCWPAHHSQFVAVAPHLVPNIPLNVNACVFPGGIVSLHAPSLQLIGIPECTSRPLGYCGNDFAQVRYLEPDLLQEFEDITVRSGKWLWQMGYLGAFGVDAIVYEGHVYLAEINPRFQGSSAVAGALMAEMGIPDLFMDHMSACLGLPPPQPRNLRILVAEQRPLAQIICHNIQGRPIARASNVSAETNLADVQLLPEPKISVYPSAILFKCIVPGFVTEDGNSLTSSWSEAVQDLRERLFPSNV